MKAALYDYGEDKLPEQGKRTGFLTAQVLVRQMELRIVGPCESDAECGGRRGGQYVQFPHNTAGQDDGGKQPSCVHDGVAI